MKTKYSYKTRAEFQTAYDRKKSEALALGWLLRAQREERIVEFLIPEEGKASLMRFLACYSPRGHQAVYAYVSPGGSINAVTGYEYGNKDNLFCYQTWRNAIERANELLQDIAQVAA